MQLKNTTAVVFAKQLGRLMEERQVTQVRLAGEFHVSQAAVSKWLKGTVPTGETLVRLAQFFGVAPEELVGMEICFKREGNPARESLAVQDMKCISKGQSPAALNAEIEVLFERLKTRVKSNLSRCSPNEFVARLKLLEELFGADGLALAKRKK